MTNTTHQWRFDLTRSDGARIVILAICGTGRWAQRVNMETGVIGDDVYVYDAIITDENGQHRNTVITRKDLLKLRRNAAKQEAAHE